MVVVLGTLGFDRETLMPTIRSTEGLSKVIVFHSDHESAKKAFAEIEDICGLMKVQVIEKEIPDAYDFLKVAREIQDVIYDTQDKGETISLFNIAGGTRIMSAAALLVCTIGGLKTAYVHDNTHEEIPLPMLRIQYSDILTDTQKKLLRYLLDHKDDEITQGDVAKAFNMHKATVNHHIKMLQDKGVVHLKVKEKDSREKIIVAEPSMELLLRR